MKILVTALNGINHVNGALARVTTFKEENNGELERITLSLKVPFYVLELKEKLQREEFIGLLNKLKFIDVNHILDAEAIKVIKKKNQTEYKDIINLIIQVG